MLETFFWYLNTGQKKETMKRLVKNETSLHFHGSSNSLTNILRIIEDAHERCATATI
jgi:hypothetical protein